MNAKHATATLVTGVTLVLSSTPALAGGEPKNVPPFTRPALDRAPAQVVRSSEQAPTGEAKNEPPFTRPVEGTTVVVSTSGGFDWTDGAIGAAVGLGLALSLVGGVVLVRTGGRREPQIAG
jgi:hypothetical protein